MNAVKVAAAAINQTPLDWDGNKRRILEVIEQARADGVHILCLPELCVSGYGCEDAFFGPGLHEMAWRMLMEIAPATHGMIVGIGVPLAFRNAVFNTAALVADGFVHGFVAKRHLAGDGIHYEPRWFKPWPHGEFTVFEREGRTYPLGDLHFDCGGLKIGFEICEDAWVASRPGGVLSSRAVDIILNPSASHFAFGKAEIRRRFVLEGSRAFGVTYVYANLMGNEAGRAIYDGGALIATGGRLVAAGPRLSFAEWQLTSAEVDVAVTRMNQSRLASFKPDLRTRGEDCVAVPFQFQPPPCTVPQVLPEWEQSPHLKEEEFLRSVTLGLFDYMRKSYSHGFVVSLSGGADSAAVSCLVALMVEHAVQELGMDTFKRRLGYLPQLRDAPDVRSCVGRMLTTLYQATRNSSDTTRSAASAVAAALGSRHMEWSIDAQVAGYRSLVEGVLGRALTWERDDIALQNIQARVRAPGVWMLANLQGALLLATSNRSEAAVGYATMDGDTAGGLSPIAGIDKAFLRRWLVWLQTHGPAGGAPIPALEAITVQAPTAELRPAERHQTDEDDLMPYDVLDACERAAIRDKKTPADTWRRLLGLFPQHRPAQLGLWVERFFRLWCRNQWKRERYAPSFHLDDENLDPRTWCRFPILSGGFEKELTELRGLLREAP